MSDEPRDARQGEEEDREEIDARRRALIQMGWTIPVVLAVGLRGTAAFGQAVSPHADVRPHIDGPPHFDGIPPL